MTGIPDASLLIQDLLSPPSTVLASTTPALVSYHLSTLSFAPASLLIAVLQTLSTSPSLWRGGATRTSSGWQPLAWGRAHEVYEAVRNGVVYRAGEVTREHGTGWTARRRFASFIEAYHIGVNAEEDCHPTIRLLLASAALAGLQIVKARKDKLYVGGTSLIGVAEAEVLKAWARYFELAPEIGARDGSGQDDQDVVPAWLATQTFPRFPIDTLKYGSIPVNIVIARLVYLTKPRLFHEQELLSLLTNAFSATFAQGSLFSSLACDLSPTPQGLHWNVPSVSHTTITHHLASPLFTSLGLLSRSIGRCVEAAGSLATPSSIVALRSTFDITERLATRIHQDWSNCAWSEANTENDFDEETQKLNEPWNALKSLLFALTLVQSSFLVILATTPATPLKRDLAMQSLRTLGLMYFVTVKFGVDGFGAWRGVWSGLMEIVRGDEAASEKLMRELQPRVLGIRQDREVDRSEVTFYLNAAEQLMKPLCDSYVEDSVLRCCRPYLENQKHRETFESAHSVLLALFATEKSCANELAPWYTELLLKAYPQLMTTSQMRLAFTTMVRCVSNSDDALAWYILQQLFTATSALPPSTSVPSPAPSPPSHSFSDPTSTSTTSRAFADPAPTTRLDEVSTLSPLETLSLKLPRGYLLLTLIDQTTSVNLVLLRSLLDQLWEFVREEEEGGSKEALVKVLFGTLGEGLDATKREEGVRYWMERGEELEA